LGAPKRAFGRAEPYNGHADVSSGAWAGISLPHAEAAGEGGQDDPIMHCYSIYQNAQELRSLLLKKIHMK